MTAPQLGPAGPATPICPGDFTAAEPTPSDTPKKSLTVNLHTTAPATATNKSTTEKPQPVATGTVPAQPNLPATAVTVPTSQNLSTTANPAPSASIFAGTATATPSAPVSPDPIAPAAKISTTTPASTPIPATPQKAPVAPAPTGAASAPQIFLKNEDDEGGKFVGGTPHAPRLFSPQNSLPSPHAPLPGEAWGQKSAAKNREVAVSAQPSHNPAKREGSGQAASSAPIPEAKAPTAEDAVKGFAASAVGPSGAGR